MRMRGYEVVAKPAPFFHDTFSEKYWYQIFKNAIIEENLPDNGKEYIKEKMLVWGDGARAEVFVVWKKLGSHVFVAENRSGEIYFLDPQTGENDVEYYFDMVQRKLTKFFRIDNLELDEKYISECCEEAAK